MSTKTLTAFLIALLFFTCSPVLAIETTGSFKIINEKNETIVSKTVSFQEGETLYEVTKRSFNTEESEGHIVSINGIRAVPEKNIHWAAFVNGHFVQLSLDEVMLNANDTIIWALRDWNNEEILK